MKITKIQTGNPIMVTAQQPVIVKKGYSPFIQNGTWWQYDETVKGYVDTGITAEGKDGQDGRDFRYEDFTAEQLAALKGEKGDPGKDGRNGIDGKNGTDGRDGYTPVKGIDYFDGEQGQPGKDGEPGKDGYTPVKGVDYFDGAPGKNGIDGKDGKNGADGKTPVKGVDYFTNSEIAEFKKDVTPIKGVDYRDGIDGQDGKNGTDGKTPVKGIDYFTASEISQIEKNAADLVEVPTKVSELENDSEYKSYKPIMSKTWEKLWNTAPSSSGCQQHKYCGWLFFKVRPVDKNNIFSLKFKGTAWMPDWTKENLTEQGLNPANYGNGGETRLYGKHEAVCELSFVPTNNKTYTRYVLDNVISDTSYRSMYYLIVGYPKTQTQEDDYYYFGWSIYSAWQYYTGTASYFEKLKACCNRTIITEILELNNCTAEFLDELIAYDTALLPNHAFSLPGITTNGITQVGDLNQLDRHYIQFYKTCDGAITAMSLVMETDEPTKIGQVFTNTSNSTAQTKTFSDRRFNIWKGIYYYPSSTVKASGTAMAGTGLYDSYPASMDLRYATNCGTNILSNVIGTDVYMVGSFDDEGYFIPAQLERVVSGKTYHDYVCDETMLPTSEDGYVYVLIGHLYGTNRYAINFYPKHPIFRHNGKYMECVGVV